MRQLLKTRSVLQRKCSCGGTCEQCAGKRKPPIVSEVLQSPGQMLDTTTRYFMESRLGHDFGHVRVHTDARAAASARAVGALAYTVGDDVVFGGGNFAPGTREGNRLLAHELTHVRQQRSGLARNAIESGDTGPFEEEANRMEETATSKTPGDGGLLNSCAG